MNDFQSIGNKYKGLSVGDEIKCLNEKNEKIKVKIYKFYKNMKTKEVKIVAEYNLEDGWIGYIYLNPENIIKGN